MGILSRLQGCHSSCFNQPRLDILSNKTLKFLTTSKLLPFFQRNPYAFLDHYDNHMTFGVIQFICSTSSIICALVEQRFGCRRIVASSDRLQPCGFITLKRMVFFVVAHTSRLHVRFTVQPFILLSFLLITGVFGVPQVHKNISSSVNYLLVCRLQGIRFNSFVSGKLR